MAISEMMNWNAGRGGGSTPLRSVTLDKSVEDGDLNKAQSLSRHDWKQPLRMMHEINAGHGIYRIVAHPEVGDGGSHYVSYQGKGVESPKEIGVGIDAQEARGIARHHHASRMSKSVNEDNDLNKAVIGKTSSGKPITTDLHENATAFRTAHSGWTRQDHSDANRAFRSLREKHHPIQSQHKHGKALAFENAHGTMANFGHIESGEQRRAVDASVNSSMGSAIRSTQYARTYEGNGLSKAKKDAPNYRASTGKQTCANCVHFDGNTCTKYSFNADASYTCDAWETAPTQKSIDFEKGDGERASRMVPQRVEAPAGPMVWGRHAVGARHGSVGRAVSRVGRRVAAGEVKAERLGAMTPTGTQKSTELSDFEKSLLRLEHLLKNE
jgi:hypothetical protein